MGMSAFYGAHDDGESIALELGISFLDTAGFRYPEHVVKIVNGQFARRKIGRPNGRPCSHL
jgi:hypothetical protein